MNFFDTTVVEEDGSLFLDGATFRLRVPEDRYGALAAYRCS